MRGSDLGVLGIIIMGCLALILSILVLLISKDPEVIKAALVIAAISGSSVTTLGGFIGGYHMGKSDALSNPGLPTTPEVESS